MHVRPKEVRWDLDQTLLKLAASREPKQLAVACPQLTTAACLRLRMQLERRNSEFCGEVLQDTTVRST